jgi:hypothetical protein
MKFYESTRANIFHGLTEDKTKLQPVIELVVSVKESKLQPFGGGFVNALVFDDYRIALSIESAKSLSETIDAFITEAERQAEKIEVKHD